MKRYTLIATAVAGALFLSSAIAAEIKSGPQTGDNLPGAFHPLNVTGPDAGKKQCLV